MSDIDEMKIRRLDLTVLLVFLALMRERKAVAVADRMGLTQSSISHSLKRLRDVFEDELFLRKPHGLEPTAIAVALEPQIRSVVDQLNQALEKPAVFDPKSSTRTIRIAAYDLELTTVVPPLIAALQEAAPGTRLISQPKGRQEALRGLDDGTTDIALGFFWEIGSGYEATPLFRETYRLVARHGHPILSGGLDAERYAAARHLVVSPAGDLTGIVDMDLERLGLKRVVAAAVPLFFPALAVLSSTDLVATLPARLVSAYAPAFGLGSREPPISVRPFTVSAVVHRREARNPLHRWLVGRIAGIASATGHQA